MEQKLPYYMMYPAPFLFDDDKTEERDYEYLKSIYPDTAKRIMPYVQEECDRMDYDTSMMFDEYPDKLQLRLMCSRIYDKVTSQERFEELESEEAELSETAFNMRGGRRPRRPDRVRDMVEILLYQELLRRRCAHRKCGRKPLW